jgi:uncharacterized protein YndB with AHSA1/START domain/catechol 2,3-dioxygenase-like lactoylglutathione lyase family enzyme
VTGLQVVASGLTDLVLTRTFAAPAPLVFAALTQPELLRQWHGAEGWHLTTCEVDLRPDGAWLFVSAGPAGAEMELHGRFLEIEPPTRLVQTEIHTGWEEGEALVTTVLTEADGRTTMTVTARYPSPEIRDAVVRTPMERGAGEAYDRLAAVLTRKEPAMTNPPVTEVPKDVADIPKDPGNPPVPPGTLLLELVPVPVADVEQAKAFYLNKLGFRLDVDVNPSEGVRVVQLTPPGSACSIALTEGLPTLDMTPGALRGLHLVVADIEKARAELVERGVEVGEVQDLGGVFYAYFADPDGNTWCLQHMPWR